MAVHTKKILAGLQADGINVSVRSLAKYMASNGVLVRPFIGRARCYIPMPDSAYGIDLKQFSEEGGTFYKQRVSQSHLNFIPPDDECALNVWEKRLRRAVEVRSLSDGFMPISAYDSLKEEFETIRKNYFQKRDEIAQKWDLLTASFTVGVEEMLKGIPMSDSARETLQRAFIAQIPSAQKYRDSFSMTLRVHAFPAENTAVPDGLSSSIAADVQATWSEEVVSTAILSVEKAVGDGWNRMLNAIRQYIKGASIRSSSLESLDKFGRDLEWKNVFRNPLLTRLSGELKGITSLDAEEQVDVIESAIAYTYAYAKEVRIELDMDKSPYTAAQLDAMEYVAESQMKKGA